MIQCPAFDARNNNAHDRMPREIRREIDDDDLMESASSEALYEELKVFFNGGEAMRRHVG